MKKAYRIDCAGQADRVVVATSIVAAAALAVKYAGGTIESIHCLGEVIEDVTSETNTKSNTGRL